ncbi:hypothetical protein Vafri_13716 [Volvox africanus]|uniref:Fungal lipase-type domain-containing protein n=1 Tax=Volvox africanus TaxID=51714 RepID=A0A8J4F6P5_9CHLO|nr:hypothetical protein Vafri_13716 [Volvox africanus]
MSTGVVAASAAAVAMYWYLFKQKGIRDDAMEAVESVEASRNADHAPSNWGEALYHVKEVLRYMYNETLGRWHTIDLFVGLAYLSHRETIEYPAADIVAKGTPLGLDCSIPEQIKLMLELQEARRYMLYCKGLKLRREEMQSRFWKEHLGADTLTIVKQQPTAGVLRPAYVVINDHALRCVVLCIRGTHSMKDLFTTLAGAAKPHHVVDPDSGRLVLGYSHLGMLAAARWLARQATPVLRMALEASPGYQLRIVGHSMGGGTAALLSMMYRGGLLGTPSTAGHIVDHTHIHSPRPSQSSVNTATSTASRAAGAGPSITTTATVAAATAASSSSADALATDPDPFLTARCVAIACPSVVTLELAAACREYVTSIINGTDIVPTFCAASVDKLREDVTQSSWFSEFSRDMRSGVIRALQGGVRGVGTATQWTSRNILQPAVVPFRACYTTTTTRKVRRRATSAVGQSTGTVAVAAAGGGAAFNSNSGSMISSAPTAPNFAQLSMAEQHEQLLLAAGAGGGAAAAAAATAAVAALEGSSHNGSPACTAHHSTLANMQETWGPPGLGPGPARPPGTQSMASVGRQRAGGGTSGVDQRAMAEAVQSCIYAVNSAVSAHHHHNHQQQGSSTASEPALAEALGLLESLPSELELGTAATAGVGDRVGGPEFGHVGSTAIAHNHLQHRHPVVYRRSLEALDATDPWRRPVANAGAGGNGGAGPSSTQAADSLFAGPTTAPLGAGGVSTAMVYGNSLRRRFWPWGQSQQQEGCSGGSYADGNAVPAATATSAAGLAAAGGAGGVGMCLPITSVGMGFGGAGNGTGIGSVSVSGSYNTLCEQESSSGGGGCGGAGSIVPPRMDAPDSPGKAKAAAAPLGGVVGAGMAASTRAISDWLWRGMLFTTCTAPRRAMPAGPAALGSAASGPGAARGVGSAGRAAAATARASESGALLMDVGDGFDDESDPEERGGARERRRRSTVEQRGSSAEGEEDGEDDDAFGSEGESDGEEAGDSSDEDEDEDGGIGVSGGGRVGDGGSGGGGGGTQSAGAAAGSEQQLQAGITAVVAAVTNQATREAVEGPTALLRDENTLAAEDVLREVREADEAASEAASGAGSTTNSLSRRRHGEETLRRREPRRGHVGSDGGGGGVADNDDVMVKPSIRRVRDTKGSEGAGVATTTASGTADPRVIGREASEGTLGRGLEEDEMPLSPGGSTINSPISGGPPERSGMSASEYEVRLYKRRLYPAGRILHLVPGRAILGQQPATAAAVQGTGTGGSAGRSAGSSTGAAACTNPIGATAASVSAAQSPHVLYEVRDPQAYSRVRLCRTMVSDHLIPAYLTALDSVLSQMELQQQRAAMDAWERELGLGGVQEQELQRQQQQHKQEERQ